VGPDTLSKLAVTSSHFTGEETKRADPSQGSFLFSSLSGHRQAIGLATSPFQAENSSSKTASLSNIMKDTKDTHSGSHKLKSMFGVVCTGAKAKEIENVEDSEEDIKGTKNKNGNRRKSTKMDKKMSSPKDHTKESARGVDESVDIRKAEREILCRKVLERLKSVEVYKDGDDPVLENIVSNIEDNYSKHFNQLNVDESTSEKRRKMKQDIKKYGKEIELEETLIVTKLELRKNSLRRQLPNCFDGLRSLVSLDLSLNGELLRGPIPRSIGELESLRHLNLSGNGLSGPLPDVLFSRLHSIVTLDLSRNKLNKEIPDFNWKQLMENSNKVNSEEAHDEGNELKKKTPHHHEHDKDDPIGKHPLPQLELIDLSENCFTGHLPHWLRTLPKIRHMKLRANKFTGTLDSLFLPPATSHESSDDEDDYVEDDDDSEDDDIEKQEDGGDEKDDKVNMFDTGVGGEAETKSSGIRSRCGGMMRRDELIKPLELPPPPLPKSGGKGETSEFFSELRSLDLSYNQFSGAIPSTLGCLRGLVTLDLSSNNFSGDFPIASLAYNRDLRHAALHGNQHLTVQAELHGAVDLAKPLGVSLDKQARVVAITPIVKASINTDDNDDADQDSSTDKKHVKFPSLFYQDDGKDENEIPQTGQGGLIVGARIVSVGDTSVSSTAEVEEALARWKFTGEKTAPISFKVSTSGQDIVEKGILSIMAPDQETRIQVDANDSRFKPSLWTHETNSGNCAGSVFNNFQHRLPGLLNIRTPGSIGDKKWDIISSTVAFGV